MTRKLRNITAVAALALACGAGVAHAETAAVLRGLDKITGHARDFSAPLNRAVRFGALEITVRSCQKSAPEEAPEVAVYIEVADRTPTRVEAQPQARKIMSGWMFASSPALNALEHPSYDVWAIDCRS